MCQQTVCLLQAAIERAGIATVSISLLREVTTVIKPPRALFVPFPMGHPLGAPNDAPLQHRIIAAALGLLERDGVPVLEEFMWRYGPGSGSDLPLDRDADAVCCYSTRAGIGEPRGRSLPLPVPYRPALLTARFLIEKTRSVKFVTQSFTEMSRAIDGLTSLLSSFADTKQQESHETCPRMTSRN